MVCTRTSDDVLMTDGSSNEVFKKVGVVHIPVHTK